MHPKMRASLPESTASAGRSVTGSLAKLQGLQQGFSHAGWIPYHQMLGPEILFLTVCQVFPSDPILQSASCLSRINICRFLNHRVMEWFGLEGILHTCFTSPCFSAPSSRCSVEGGVCTAACSAQLFCGPWGVLGTCQ